MTNAARSVSRFGTGLRRLGLLALVLISALAVTGCTKSEAQLSSEALQRGVEAHNAGSLQEAQENYAQALRHDPANVMAIFNLGLVASQLGDQREAENRYRMALSTDPDYAPALWNLALLRIDAGSLPEVVDLLQRYVLVRPNEASAHLRLSQVLTQLGRTDEAAAALARAAELDPSVVAPPVASSPAP